MPNQRTYLILEEEKGKVNVWYKPREFLVWMEERKG